MDSRRSGNLPIVISSLLAILTTNQRDVSTDLLKHGLADLGAFRMLEDITAKVGPRLSGSVGAAKGVTWVQKEMLKLGFSNVGLVPCMVPHWVQAMLRVDSLARKSNR